VSGLVRLGGTSCFKLFYSAFGFGLGAQGFQLRACSIKQSVGMRVSFVQRGVILSLKKRGEGGHGELTFSCVGKKRM